MRDDESMREVLADREVERELAERARDLWDDPDVLAPRDACYSRDSDSQMVAWALFYGLLP